MQHIKEGRTRYPEPFGNNVPPSKPALTLNPGWPKNAAATSREPYCQLLRRRIGVLRPDLRSDEDVTA